MMGMSRPTSGMVTILADEVLVARILGMDGHGGVAEHGFGPRRGETDELRFCRAVGFVITG